MERKRREELAEYFEAPKPLRKQAFVRQFGLQRMDLAHVIVMQARYISKGVWSFSALIFGLAFLLAQAAEPKYVSVILGCVPFLVMLSVTESMRSYRYGMEELELSARFSLKSILLARMVLLGLGNLTVLAGVLVVLRGYTQFSFVYVMAPYFVTAAGGLCIARTVRGKESTLLCFALSALVCMVVLYMPWQFEEIFSPQNAWIWAVACVAGVIMTIRESWLTIRMTEELA